MLHLSHARKRRKKAKAQNIPIKAHHTILDYLVYFIAIASPLMTIPQICDIWILGLKEGVSFMTWSAYFVASIVWLIYGIVHKDKPIIVSNILWVFMNGMVAVGVM